jgi:hypothetical protein
MRAGLLFALVIASCGGSGESQCEKYCDSIRDQLIMNFDVQPDQINCADPEWDTGCQQCLMTLESKYGVQPTSGLQECESL